MGSFVIRFGRETSFFRWARRGEKEEEAAGGGPLFQFQKSQSISPPSQEHGWGEGGSPGRGRASVTRPSLFFLFPTSLPSHPHLQQHLSLIFLFYFYYLFRLCFFPLHRSALLTPPTSLFPWHICNPERRRRKRRRRERKGAARKNGCHCSALMVFCV